MAIQNPTHAIVSLRGKLLLITRLEVAYGPQDTSTLFDHYHPRIRTYSHRLKDIEIVALSAATSLPIWIPIISFATVGAIPWLRWRFTLRTLLIATTLVAVGLGLIGWATH